MQIPSVRPGLRRRIPRGHPRVRKALWWLVGIVAFIAVTGFLVAPPIVKWQAEKQLATLLDRTVAIDSVSINPFALSAQVAGLRVNERDGDGVALAFDTLYARLSYRTFVNFAPVIAEARLDRPLLRITRTDAKTYSFQDLLEKFGARATPEPTQAGEPTRFSLNNLQLIDGNVELDDRAKNQQHAVTGINVSVPFISNFDAHVAVFVQPKLEAMVNGDPLRITGETKPFDDTLETRVALNLSNVDLPRYLDYSPVPLPFSVPAGKIDAALSATFRQSGARQANLVVSGNVAVREFALADAGGAPVLAFSQLGIVVNSLDPFGRKVDIARIGLESPALDLRREKDGSLNLASLMPILPTQAQARADETPAKPFAFEIGEIAVTHGLMTVADLVPEKPFRRRIEKLELSARGLSSVESSRANVEIGFESIATGTDTAPAVPARVDYTGEVQLAPVKVGGKLQVLQLKLADLYPYYEAAINAKVQSGTADLSVVLDVAVGGGEPTGRVSEITATLSDIRLQLPDSSAPFLAIPTASIEAGEADLATRRVTIGKVAIDSPAYAIERDADGTLNASRLLRTVPGEGTGSTGSAPWVVTLNRLELGRGRATFEDRAVKPRVKVALRDMTLTGTQLGTAEDSQGEISFRTTVNRAGSVSLRGQISPTLTGTLAVVASRIDLVPFNPYLAPHTKADVASGSVAARGSLTIKRGKDVQIAYKGGFEVAGLALRHEKGGDDLLKWQSLRLSGIDAASEPLRFSVDEIALSDFFARLVLDASGQLNLQELAGNAPGGTGPGPAPGPVAVAAKSTAPTPTDAGTRTPDDRKDLEWIRIGRVRLQNGNVDFSDFFVRPNYRADLTALAGSISTLSFDQPADLELSGTLNQTAPLEIRGRLNLLAAQVTLDIQASARDIELPRLSPYSAKYLGYGIERGKLSVKVKYALADRKLSAENNLYLDQLKLGEKVASPDAADLPVPLAISLLQDRNGVIDVNLPISGSIDDPEFSVAGIVLQVIGNIITKAVTAPFALLGAIGGAEGGLDYLEFAPGSARLTQASEKKLAALGKALADRPGVKLDVTGRADPATDRAGLQRAAVDTAVKREKFDRLRASGEAPKSADEVTVDAKEYPGLLKRAYGEAEIPGKPRNVLGFQKDIPVPEMEKLMHENASASDEDLRNLAINRAQAAKDYLTDPGKIPAERVFIVAPKVATEVASEKSRPNRVEFALR